MATQDYSQSAINLCNPEEVGRLLEQLRQAQEDLGVFQKQLDEANKELVALLHDQSDKVTGLTNQIKESVEQYGSYQDLEASLIAVKQRKVSKTYDAAKFKALFPKFADAVIEEAINVNALKGLLKGNLIGEEELKPATIERESFAYIIRA